MAKYLNGIIAGAIVGDHGALAAAPVCCVDACSRSFWGVAGLLHAALDIIWIIRAVVCQVEARKYTVACLLTGASAMLILVLANASLWYHICLQVPESYSLPR